MKKAEAEGQKRRKLEAPGSREQKTESGWIVSEKVSPLQTPVEGDAGAKSLEAGGAAEREVQAGPFNGVSSSFSDLGQRLRVGVQQILNANLQQMLSLRQVGPCLLQCFSFCCKPLPMADDHKLEDDALSSACTVSSGPPLAVWGQATGLALRSVSGELHEDKPTILKRVEVKKSIERQLSRFDMWDEHTDLASFDNFFKSRGVDYTGEMVKLA